MILIDTSGLLAAMFEDQRHHEACAHSPRGGAPGVSLTPDLELRLRRLEARYKREPDGKT